MIPRRGLLAGLGALLAAPAIIRTPGLLMPVRPVLALPRIIYDDLQSFLAELLARQDALLDWSDIQAQTSKDVEFLTGIRWTDDELARIGRKG